MNKDSIQNSLLKAIDTIVEQRVLNSEKTVSRIGIVKTVLGFDAQVDIQGELSTCVLPEHLHSWIDVDDIVVVQDLYGNNSNKVITGKTGTTRSDSFVILDESSGKFISGVERIHDTTSNSEVDSHIVMSEE